MKYTKHVFICTNQRKPGQRKSCGEECGTAIVEEFKKELKERKLNTVMRAQRTGCLDVCETGPSVVVYPDGVFYGNVSPADVKEIVEEHLLHNRPVRRLVVHFEEIPRDEPGAG